MTKLIGIAIIAAAVVAMIALEGGGAMADGTCTGHYPYQVTHGHDRDGDGIGCDRNPRPPRDQVSRTNTTQSAAALDPYRQECINLPFNEVNEHPRTCGGLSAVATLVMNDADVLWAFKDGEWIGLAFSDEMKTVPGSQDFSIEPGDSYFILKKDNY